MVTVLGSDDKPTEETDVRAEEGVDHRSDKGS